MRRALRQHQIGLIGRPEHAVSDRLPRRVDGAAGTGNHVVTTARGANETLANNQPRADRVRPGVCPELRPRRGSLDIAFRRSLVR
jgi:hypothetical protein